MGVTTKVAPFVELSKYWSIVDQDTYDREIDLQGMAESLKDPFHGSVNKTSLKNAIRVVYQLQSLKKLFLAHDDTYTHIILSRVDLLFTRRVLPSMFETRVGIPNYADFDKKARLYDRLNDRFVAGPKQYVLKLMDRVEPFHRTHKIAESLMYETALFHGVEVKRMRIGLSRRIRTRGELHEIQYTANRRRPGCIMDTATNMEELKPYSQTLRRITLCE